TPGTTNLSGPPQNTTGPGDGDTTDTGPDDASATIADATSASSGDPGTTGNADSTGPGDDTTMGEDSSTGPMVEACDQVDQPDINGLDENGDGIDGLAGCSVFVNAATGSDLNDGLAPDDPVATIARGIEIATTFSPPRPVLVA